MRSGYRPIGEPTIVHENRSPDGNRVFWDVRAQSVHNLDQAGNVRSEGIQYYGHMNPGSLIVALEGDSHEGRALLIPQERWTANVVEGQTESTRRQYELPGGGMDEEKTPKVIIETAERELAEETGYGAESFRIIGNTLRGLYPHPALTDQNLTVLATDAHPLDSGTAHEDSESIGDAEWFSWTDMEDMVLSDEGLWTPSGPKHISSAPSWASISLARTFLRREERNQPVSTVIDLGSGPVNAAIPQPPMAQ